MTRQSLLTHTIVDTSIGHILIVGSQQGLRRISIYISRKSALENVAQQFPESIESPDAFADLPQRLKEYSQCKRIIFNDKLDFSKDTAFKRAVWEATCAIPYGETRSYAWIAQRVGKPKAARAVGQALKYNPFPIIVPCHRVIGKDGSLTGFSCGMDIKKRLLDMEASSPSKNRTH
jgi:methylated-DNA-[protein]-cysteine S-methyltransferase